MQKKTLKLKFSDILWLYIISRYSTPPSLRETARLYNEFLDKQQVPPVHIPIKGVSKMSEIVNTLRQLGYVSPTGRMEVLEHSNELWEHIGMDWKHFPMEIPIVNGKPQWDKAVVWEVV